MNTQLKARAWRYASAALWSAGLATTVHAQQQAAQGLEEIIVTARKVEENL